MQVHEVVTQAVDYVNGNLLAEKPSNAQLFGAIARKMEEDGGWLNHGVLLQPPEGRRPNIRERVDERDVMLVHPVRAYASDLRLGTSEPVPTIRFHDSEGSEVSPIDLCIRLSDIHTWKSSSYVASRGFLYAIALPERIETGRDREAVTSAEVSSIGAEEALEIAFTAVRAVLNLPVSVRGVKRDRWIMHEMIDRGVSGTSLRSAEKALWELTQAMEGIAPEPPETHPLFPGARRIGYGFEWVAYLLPDGKSVAKVPRGVFPEVAEPGYLFAAKDAYDACKTFITDFTVTTSFARTDETNVQYQDFLDGRLATAIDPAGLTAPQRANFRTFGEGLMMMLEDHEWFPDLWLARSEDGLWHMKNVMIVDDTPLLYDFTAIYDDYRLSPERTREETAQTMELLRTFILDMSAERRKAAGRHPVSRAVS